MSKLEPVQLAILGGLTIGFLFGAPLIPRAKPGGNKRSIDEREVMNGIMYIRAMHLTQVTQFVVAGSCRNIHARCWSFAIGSRTMRRAGTISPSCGGRRGSAARYAEGRIIGSRRGACVTAGSAVGRPR